MRRSCTAGWVRGHARVTGVVPATSEHPSTLFASPLHVQFGRMLSRDIGGWLHQKGLLYLISLPLSVREMGYRVRALVC